MLVVLMSHTMENQARGGENGSKHGYVCDDLGDEEKRGEEVKR